MISVEQLERNVKVSFIKVKEDIAKLREEIASLREQISKGK